jgi:broad specificity phosphatase PhoE
MDTRLLLISHASTASMTAARFPARHRAAFPGDDPLDARGLALAEAARGRLPLPDNTLAFVSPEHRTRETAATLGIAAAYEDALADLDYGEWHGRKLADLEAEAPDALATWTRDPDANAHGGESFSQLVRRIGNWLDAPDGVRDQPRPVVAVTHATVIRAAIVHALEASPATFLRIEIAPLSLVELRYSRRGWTWWPGALVPQ